MSVNSTSPATLFGGTWERITGSFLLAATDNGSSGASQEAGNTGGAATVTLTSDQSGVPAHSHGLNSHTHSVGAHSHGLNSHTHSVGAHSHGLNSHTHTYSKSNTPTAGTSISIAQLPKNYATFGTRSVYNGFHSFDPVNATVTATSNSGTVAANNGTTAKNAIVVLTGSASAHSHTINFTSTNSGAASGSTANSTAFNSGAASGSTENSTAFNSGAASGSTENNTVLNASSAHENMPPYLAVYVWKRTA